MGAKKKKAVTITQVARELKLDPSLVLGVICEKSGVEVSREEKDRIFKTARRLGYDFYRLRIGKRIQVRKEALDEAIATIEGQPNWGRAEILKYLKDTGGLHDRIHNRVFTEKEFGGGK